MACVSSLETLYYPSQRHPVSLPSFSFSLTLYLPIIMNTLASTRAFLRKKKNLYLSSVSVKRNQKRIIELANTQHTIFLNPVPPPKGEGNIEHYYHFLFDLILPLSILIDKTPPGVVFSLEEFGNLTPLLSEILGDRVTIQSDTAAPSAGKIDLIGMDPLHVAVNRSQFQNLRKLILRAFQLEACDTPTEILLIERIPPDPYYLNDAQIKGAGASRRSIRNHQEFCDALRSQIKPPYEFHNLQLEKLSFKEQLKHFNAAAVVIAQHGAGLANIVWMKDQSVVIELGFKSFPHFKILSAAKKHQYFLLNYLEEHIDVKTDVFSQWIAEQPELAQFFKLPL